MAFSRLLSLTPGVIALGFLVGYVGLHWLSVIQPIGSFGITPWNPPTGLGFVLILVFGQRYAPLLFVAPLMADAIVGGFPVAWGVELATTLAIGGGYTLAALALLRPGLKFDLALTSMRDLLLFLAAAALSAAAVAGCYVLVHASAGLVPWSEAGAAWMRYWVGDLIGVAVVAPFLLVLLTRGRPFEASLEALLQLAAIGACLAVVFATAHDRQFELFYLMFLPVVWIAVRNGLEGVTVGLMLTQLGLLAALQVLAPAEVDATAFQALMLVLTLTGLATGVLVTERRRAELQLRLQQDAQARLTRLGSMGELASALAHEINQPLMAAGTFTRLAAHAIATGAPPEKASAAAHKAVAQVERAAEVVRRLRDLIRLGRSEVAPVPVSRFVLETLELLRPDFVRSQIRIEQRIAPDLPPVLADVLQVEQVLLNLVRNAVEAIRDSAGERGLVSIEAERLGAGFVEVRVRDTGPGFDQRRLADPMLPFDTSKADGLGVGLSLSRSIIEAHGGRLTISNGAQGALVRFTLPVAEASK